MMKYCIKRDFTFLTCAFLVMAATVFSQTNVVDKAGKKQGYWKRLDAMNKPVYEGTFKDDIPTGEFNYYYETGQVKVISVFSNMGKVTRTKMYYENGKKKAEGKYVSEKKDSTWKFYSEEEILLSEENFKDGKKEGKFITYFRSGKIAEEKTWKNDVENGPWKQYFENGTVKIDCTYNAGFLEGSAKFYFMNGKISIDGNYQHAVKHGNWKYFKSDGSLDRIEKWKLGKMQGGKDPIITPQQEEKERQQGIPEPKPTPN